jgi:very-short-patch-repair endonuclease
LSRKKIIPYNPKLKELARNLRNRSTLSEVLLWQQLKSRQIRGYKLLRQKPIDAYIVDFFCQGLILAIEIDGETHNYKISADRVRQNRLGVLGIKVLRFLDIDIKRNMDGVLKMIHKYIEKIEKEHPSGPPQGGIP